MKMWSNTTYALVGCASLFLVVLFWISVLAPDQKPCKLNGSKTPECVLKEHLVFPESSQKRGKYHAKNSRVVICGLIRDGANKLLQNIPRIEKIAGMFSDYRILVVENDSVDSTRRVLLNWVAHNPRVTALGCGVNATLCKIGTPPTIDHEVTSRRIHKMAMLRNVYIDYIKTHFPTFDYMLVYDFDLVGQIYKDGLRDSFNILSTRPDVQGLTANGVMHSRYYDPFAIFGWDSPSCFNNPTDKKLDERRLLELVSPGRGEFRFDPNNGLVPVKSAFAGLAIYRLPRILATDASYSLRCLKITCEHTAFSEMLGGIFINPKMVLMVYEH
jgi:hypothetical protein